MKKLTIRQAFFASYFHLDQLYKLTHSVEVGDMLSDMSLLEDGSTADPASWQDWIEAVEEAVKDDAESKCTLSNLDKKG